MLRRNRSQKISDAVLSKEEREKLAKNLSANEIEMRWEEFQRRHGERLNGRK